MSFATKRIGTPCCTLFTFVTCYPLQITLSQNYLLRTISVLAEKTLLKTICHFLLLLVGFDTLTYQKDYDRSPILVGHQSPSPIYIQRSTLPQPVVPSTWTWCFMLISLSNDVLPSYDVWVDFRCPIGDWWIAMIGLICLWLCCCPIVPSVSRKHEGFPL